LTICASYRKLDDIADPVETFRAAIQQAASSGELDRLSASQRALLGAQHVTTSHGGARHRGAGFKPLRSALPYSKICDTLGIGSKTLVRAVKLHRSGRADLVDDVAAGRMSLAEAVRRL